MQFKSQAPPQRAAAAPAAKLLQGNNKYHIQTNKKKKTSRSLNSRQPKIRVGWSTNTTKEQLRQLLSKRGPSYHQ